MNPEITRDILEQALEAGGKVLRDHYGKTQTTTIKESISSIVTEADLASEKAIIEVLDSAPFSFNILSEESGYHDRKSDWTWVIDPLDGTSNFAAGLPWFGIIVTLFQGTDPAMGAMYLPVGKDLYMAETGSGAWKNGQRITCATNTRLSEILISYSFDFSDVPGKTETEMELMGRLSKRIRNIRSTNCLIDFCYTVEGKLGAAVNQTTKIWDIASPWLIAREAGGVVTDIQGDEIKFDLTMDGLNKNYTIIAAGSGLIESLLGLINQ